MATATFNTIPAEQTTLVAPKKTTVSWRVLVIGAFMTVFVLGAATMTLYKTPPTTMEMPLKTCRNKKHTWNCPSHSYSSCALDTSETGGNPICAYDLISPCGDATYESKKDYNCQHWGLSWNCCLDAYSNCALTTSGKPACAADLMLNNPEDRMSDSFEGAGCESNSCGVHSNETYVEFEAHMKEEGVYRFSMC